MFYGARSWEQKTEKKEVAWPKCRYFFMEQGAEPPLTPSPSFTLVKINAMAKARTYRLPKAISTLWLRKKMTDKETHVQVCCCFTVSFSVDQ